MKSFNCVYVVFVGDYFLRGDHIDELLTLVCHLGTYVSNLACVECIQCRCQLMECGCDIRIGRDLVCHPSGLGHIARCYSGSNDTARMIVSEGDTGSLFAGRLRQVDQRILGFHRLQRRRRRAVVVSGICTRWMSGAGIMPACCCGGAMAVMVAERGMNQAK